MANAILNENSSRTTENLPTAFTCTPRIYVACRETYEAGGRHGCWIDANQSVESIEIEIQNMLLKSLMPDAKEWDIHDHEGFYGIHFQRCYYYQRNSDCHEYDDLERVSKAASILAEHTELGAKVIQYFNGDLKRAQEFLEEGYHGCYDSLEEYAQESVTTQLEDFPWLVGYTSLNKY